MAEEHDSWLRALGVDLDALRTKAAAIAAPPADVPSAGDLAEGAAQHLIDANASLVHSVIAVVPLPEGVKDAADGAADFSKGMAEGAVAGVAGLAGSVQSAIDDAEGKALADGMTRLAAAATDADARHDLVQDVGAKIDKAEGAAKFGAALLVDPVGTGSAIGERIGDGYNQAAATGDGAEYLGEGAGRAAVAIAGFFADGAAEGAELATEGGELAEAGSAATSTAEVGAEGSEVTAQAAETTEAVPEATEPTEVPVEPDAPAEADAPVESEIPSEPPPFIIDQPTIVPPTINPPPYVPFELPDPSLDPVIPPLPPPPKIIPDPTRLPPGAFQGPEWEEGL
jgi:hypothetical protein